VEFVTHWFKIVSDYDYFGFECNIDYIRVNQKDLLKFLVCLNSEIEKYENDITD